MQSVSRLVHRRLLLPAAGIAVVLLAAGRGQAATLNVPTASYPTIQSGIDAAADGDTIVVAAGTYPESITWSTKSLTLQGAGAGQSVIDPSTAAGGPGGRCIAVLGVPSTASIQGFTFQNGVTTTYGGGMSNTNSSPTITNCAFNGNTASSPNSATTYGGGIFNDDSSSPTITNCVFNGNSGFDGGGIFDGQTGSPAIIHCIFSGNSAAAGGAMFNDGSPTVTNCAFSGNTATFGGGVLNDGGSPTVTGCLFSGNTAFEGAAMRNDGESSPTVTNSSFSGNTATHDGGGIDNRESNPTITNCILWGDMGGEIYNETTMGLPPSSPTITYSDVQGGYSGTGNINSDPLFVRNPFTNGATDYGDLRLRAGSSCINAGNNSVVTSPPFLTDSSGTIIDLDGNPRIVGGTVDMGAYEFQGAAAITSVSPESATPGTLIEINGANLATTRSVTFNGVKAYFQTANDGLVWTYVPNNAAPGANIIQVTTAIGAATTTFTVLAPPAPTIASVSPESATPGTLIDINGTNLATTNSVTFSGVKAYFQTASDSLVWTYVPNNAMPGASTVQVTTAAGSTTASFTVLAPPAPTIASVSPGSATPGTLIDINGTNLATTNSVTFNGMKAYFQTASDGLVWTYVPNNAMPGASTVQVTTAAGSTTASFTVLAPPAPTIASVSPGSATPGTLIEINGANLATTRSVTFNGVKAYFQTANDGLVWTYVPAGAPVGADTIQVTTAGGSITASFTVIAPPAPTITSVSPDSGPAGTFVTIQGTAFTTTNSVTFNGVRAYYQAANDDLLWVYVPGGAAGGTGGLVVTNATGSATTAFTVTP